MKGYGGLGAEPSEAIDLEIVQFRAVFAVVTFFGDSIAWAVAQSLGLLLSYNCKVGCYLKVSSSNRMGILTCPPQGVALSRPPPGFFGGGAACPGPGK